MSDEERKTPALVTLVREARARWDGTKQQRPLSTGGVAALKRCATVQDVLLEGAFWSLLRESYEAARRRGAEDSDPRLAEALAVVALGFPYAKQGAEGERFGRTLARALAAKGLPEERCAQHFRKLLAQDSADGLAHRLRALLRLCETALDWGAFAEDAAGWCRGGASRDRVRRRWAEDFYGAAEPRAERDEDAETAPTGAGTGTA